MTNCPLWSEEPTAQCTPATALSKVNDEKESTYA